MRFALGEQLIEIDGKSFDLIFNLLYSGIECWLWSRAHLFAHGVGY